MSITNSSDSLVAAVADPTAFLLNELDLAALTLRLRSAYPTLDIDLLVSEYRRFLVLKLAHRDERAKLLSPSPMIDKVWHKHIDDTRSYIGMCLTIGFWIYHDPDGASDSDAANRARRREKTKQLYAARFGAANQDVWDMEGIRRPFLTAVGSHVGMAGQKVEERARVPFVKHAQGPGAPVAMSGPWASAQVPAKSNPVARTLVRQREAAEADWATKKSGPGAGEPVANRRRQSDVFVIRLRYSHSEWPSQSFKVHSSTLFDNVAQHFAESERVEVSDLRFHFAGTGNRIRVGACLSMQDLGLQDEDVIDVDEYHGAC